MKIQLLDGPEEFTRKVMSGKIYCQSMPAVYGALSTSTFINTGVAVGAAALLPLERQKGAPRAIRSLRAF